MMRRSLFSLLTLLTLSVWQATPMAAAGCPPLHVWPSDHDCPHQVATPDGYPTQGGTITVHAGITYPCVVRLPGHVVLCAGGETAPLFRDAHRGRAIFRVSGEGPDGPGGLNIIVSATTYESDRAPEVLPALHAAALLTLPPDTVLMYLEDTSTLRYTIVTPPRLLRTGLYKVLRQGRSPEVGAASPELPTDLPATGGQPLMTVLTLALVLVVAGGILLVGTTRRVRRPGGTTMRRVGAAVCLVGVLIGGGGGLSDLYQRAHGVVEEFGTLAVAVGPLPRVTDPTLPTATSAMATRLVARAAGIDTPVIPLGIVGGAWQLPSFAAGQLIGSAMPGTVGNTVLTGHDDRDGSVFRRLDALRFGDTIDLYVAARRYRYAVVTRRVVPPTRINVLRSTLLPVLTLITCTPYLDDSQRLVVQARLVS